MNDIKPWYSSRTIWGSLVAVLAGLLQVLGLELDAGGQMELADALVAIAGGLGGLVAVYGRLAAKKKLG